MKEDTSSPRMLSIIVLYDMQTTFFKSAIDGISDSDAHNRLQKKANHVAWLAGSIVQQRFELATILGDEHRQSAHVLFKDNKGIQDNLTYPSLDSFKKDWEIIMPVVRKLLININDDHLDKTFEMMPGMNMTYYELITFITYREANIIGQIALWRRLLGYEAMKYM
jgi:hypothetical protein